MKIKLVDQRVKILTPIRECRSFERRIERAGRVCYKSEDKITPGSSRDFVQRIINNGHESVFEHCFLSVLFTTDRAMANALVRHRHCAFSQESTHYINYLKKDEIQIIKQVGFPNEHLRWASQIEIDLYCRCRDIVPAARRSLLPLCLKTELVMTTNIREWRHILKIRTAKGCHPQMRALILELLSWFKGFLPIFVSDISEFQK